MLINTTSRAVQKFSIVDCGKIEEVLVFKKLQLLKNFHNVSIQQLDEERLGTQDKQILPLSP